MEGSVKKNVYEFKGTVIAIVDEDASMHRLILPLVSLPNCVQFYCRSETVRLNLIF